MCCGRRKGAKFTRCRLCGWRVFDAERIMVSGAGGQRSRTLMTKSFRAGSYFFPASICTASNAFSTFVTGVTPFFVSMVAATLPVPSITNVVRSINP